MSTERIEGFIVGAPPHREILDARAGRGPSSPAEISGASMPLVTRLIAVLVTGVAIGALVLWKVSGGALVFIERYLGYSPDGGDGSVELLYLLGLAGMCAAAQSASAYTLGISSEFLKSATDSLLAIFPVAAW